MDKAPIELHTFFNSSTAFRVRIALELKGLQWSSTTVNLRDGEHRREAFEAVNPAQQVPVLVHNGRSITQSLAIIDYLDGIEPTPLLIPASGWSRTRVLEAASVVASDMHQVNNMRTQKYLSERLSVTPEQRTAWVMHWWHTGFRALEALLPQSSDGWSMGEGPTLVDCCLVPQVANALRGDFDVRRYPRIWCAYEHCMGHAAFQRAAPCEQADFVAH